MSLQSLEELQENFHKDDQLRRDLSVSILTIYKLMNSLLDGKCKSSYKISLTFEITSQRKSRLIGEKTRVTHEFYANDSKANLCISSLTATLTLSWLRRQILRKVFGRHSAIKCCYVIVSWSLCEFIKLCIGSNEICTELKSQRVMI